jgi:hypothetical protein
MLLRERSPSRIFLHTSVLLVAILGLYLLLPWSIRFARVELNYLVAAVLFLVPPLPALALAIATHVRWRKVAWGIVAIVFATPCVLMAILTLIWNPGARGEFDPAMRRLDELAVGRARYRLYLADCGATCRFELALRREFDLPLGVQVVRPLWQRSGDEAHLRRHADDIQVVSRGRILWEEGH